MTEPVVKVDGDPVGGFIVGVHDGDRHGTFTMFVENVEAAIAAGLRMFRGEPELPPVVDAPVVAADDPIPDTQAVPETGA